MSRLCTGHSLQPAVLVLAILGLAVTGGGAEQPPRPAPRPAAPAWPSTADPGQITVCLFEGLAAHQAFPEQLPAEAFRFTTPALALHRLPLKYTAGGVRQTWSGPLLLQAFGHIDLPAGETELLIRSPGLARLWIDGRVVAQTPPRRLFPDAHQPFVVYQPDLPWLRVPFVGDHEVRVRVQSPGGIQPIVLEAIVGSSKSRCELGETLVAVRQGDAMFTLAAPAATSELASQLASESEPAAPRRPIALVDSEFVAYRDQLEQQLAAIDGHSLRDASAAEDAFWQQRHAIAQEYLQHLPQLPLPEPSAAWGEHNLVDRYLNAGLPTAPPPTTADRDPPRPGQLDRVVDDLAFLRRVTLDTVGVPPSLAEIEAYLATESSAATSPSNDNSTDNSTDISTGHSATTPRAERRTAAVARLLADERWADHWVSYWQDVLAENPNILKPKLNNTGPFRWWLSDALRLNKPMDRFATELIRMEGSPYAGAAAGFGWATENDLPMAEKAHIIAGAFLSIDMKCARCHDAPYHPWSQRDLFSLAAMLDNAPLKVPATSSVPRAFFDRRGDDAPIAVTLQPGEEVAPHWPHEVFAAHRPLVGTGVPQSEANPAQQPEPIAEFSPAPVDDGLLGRPRSPREELAALITRPENRRFAATIVNRLWTRWMGWGLVSDTDDWFEAEVRHPELLEYLSRELVASGYDLKHVAHLILTSRAYQRQALDQAHLYGPLAYTAPWRHRLTAEQVVDSLHHVAGVTMDTEAITFDPEASQRIENFLNLGEASRAWQLTSLSNERDRPSLSLPKAATIVECLEAFGWRQSRQSPLTHREQEANISQPGVVANGTLAGSLTRLTDHSLATQLALDSRTPAEFTERLFLAALTRAPSPGEQQVFVEQLETGFQDRHRQPPQTQPAPPPSRGFATWSNHFAVEANALLRQIEMEVAAGPAPTLRLASQWRERAEDAIWALVNSPEFQFVP